MSQWNELMNDALDFTIGEFGRDEQTGEHLYLVIAGKRIPIAQSSLPRDSDSLAGGYITFGAGEVTCRKCDLLDATGGTLPKLDSMARLQVGCRSDLQYVQITGIDTSHGDPGVILTLLET